MIKNKKWYLGAITLASIATPIATVIACGSGAQSDNQQAVNNSVSALNGIQSSTLAFTAMPDAGDKKLAAADLGILDVVDANLTSEYYVTSKKFDKVEVTAYVYAMTPPATGESFVEKLFAPDFALGKAKFTISKEMVDFTERDKVEAAIKALPVAVKTTDATKKVSEVSVAINNEITAAAGFFAELKPKNEATVSTMLLKTKDETTTHITVNVQLKVGNEIANKNVIVNGFALGDKQAVEAKLNAYDNTLVSSKKYDDMKEFIDVKTAAELGIAVPTVKEAGETTDTYEVASKDPNSKTLRIKLVVTKGDAKVEKMITVKASDAS